MTNQVQSAELVDEPTAPFPMEAMEPNGQTTAIVPKEAAPLSIVDEVGSSSFAAQLARSADDFDDLRRVLLTRVIPRSAWVDMGGKPYLEGGGAQAVFRFLGWQERNVQFRTETMEGQKVISCTFDLVDRQGAIRHQAGGLRPQKNIVADEWNARPAAKKNAYSHVARDVLGLGSMSWELLGTDYGIKPSGKVSYDTGSKGGRYGGTDSKTGERTIRFGNQKGMPLSQADTRDLEWYGAALERSVNDPSKAKWRAQNEADLEAVQGILWERDQAKDQPAPRPSVGEGSQANSGPPAGRFSEGERW